MVKKKSKSKVVINKAKVESIKAKNSIKIGLDITEVVAKVGDSFVPMDDDFESDWMVERGVEKGEDWDVCGSRRDACEVKLRNGVIVGPCYFDVDKYERVDGERGIPVSQVVAVRYYEVIEEEIDKMGRDTFSDFDRTEEDDPVEEFGDDEEEDEE